MKFISEKNQPTPTENVALLRSAFRRQLWKCIFFSLVVVCVIAIFSVAWFVSNSQVRSSVTPISAGFDPIKLATRGERQKFDYYLNLEKPDGDMVTYNGEEYYCSNGDTIALRLSRDSYEVFPGSKGKVEFYIIPGGGVSKVTLQIGLGAYSEDDNKTVNRINDDVLNALMSGHILLFDSYENGVYSDWLFQENESNSGIFNNSITVDLSDKSKDAPVLVDFYWIWPLRYENMLNDLNGVQEFIEEQSTDGKMTPLNTPLNSGYRYSHIFLTNKTDLSLGTTRSEAYDLADEYIGSNAQYLYLTIQTSASDDMEGGMQ